MRQIKFRAWDGEKMHYYPDWSTLHKKKCLVFEEDHVYVDESDYDNNLILMQFTGRKDKALRQIYERDILKGRSTDMYDYTIEKGATDTFGYFEVKWDEERCGWQPLNYFNTNGVNDLCNEFFDFATCEVVGNTYENPELLQKLSE